MTYLVDPQEPVPAPPVHKTPEYRRYIRRIMLQRALLPSIVVIGLAIFALWAVQPVSPIESIMLWAVLVAMSFMSVGTTVAIYEVAKDAWRNRLWDEVARQTYMTLRIEALAWHWLVLGLERIGDNYVIEIARGKGPLYQITVPACDVIIETGSRPFLTFGEVDYRLAPLPLHQGDLLMKGQVVLTLPDPDNPPPLRADIEEYFTSHAAQW